MEESHLFYKSDKQAYILKVKIVWNKLHSADSTMLPFWQEIYMFLFLLSYDINVFVIKQHALSTSTVLAIYLSVLLKNNPLKQRLSTSHSVHSFRT